MGGLAEVLELTPRSLVGQNSSLQADSVNAAMVEEAKEIFGLFDKDGDCSIPTQELGTAMRALGTFPKETELVQLNEIANEVSFEQFLQLHLKQKTTEVESEEEIKDAFGAVCGLGKVSVPVLEDLLLKVTGEELMDEELSELQEALALVKEEDNSVELSTLMELLLGDLKKA